MITARVAATRSNHVRARRRLAQIRKGVDLLTRKREALVAELMRQARPAVGLRQAVDGEAAAAYRALLEALAAHGATGVTAMGWPLREVTVDVDVRQIWGIPVPVVERRPPLVRTVPARGTAPGMVGPAAAAAARRFERLAELLLDTLPQDTMLRRVGAALATTTRRVNTLQQRITPALERQLTDIGQTLIERERDEQVRLRHLIRRRAPRASRGRAPSTRTSHVERGSPGAPNAAVRVEAPACR